MYHNLVHGSDLHSHVFVLCSFNACQMQPPSHASSTYSRHYFKYHQTSCHAASCMTLMLPSKEVKPKSSDRVNESSAFTPISTDRINSTRLIRSQLNGLEISPDPALVTTLWQNSPSFLQSPTNQYLCDINSSLMRNCFDDGVFKHFLACGRTLML